jgi:Asp-tRNA(Asn)/Glu-tRNA(Gln) amidotransferase A subunit family amidase
MEAYQSSKYTPMDLVREIFSAVKKSNEGDKAINAIIRINETEVLKQAEDSWQRIQAGKPLSALDGIPVIVKENIDIAGYPTSHGTNGRIVGKEAVRSDAPMIERLRKTGAIVLGKSSTLSPPPNSVSRIVN